MNTESGTSKLARSVAQNREICRMELVLGWTAALLGIVILGAFAVMAVAAAISIWKECVADR